MGAATLGFPAAAKSINRNGKARRMPEDRYLLHPIGRVESPLTDRALAPKQGDEGSPDAWLVFNPDMTPALADFAVDTEVILLTWLDRADRSVLNVRPRGDQEQPEVSVFVTRSPERPNPIGLHTVRILEIAGTRVRVRNLEALDGTPILDIKSMLGPIGQR